jgi:hypothetical protein
MRDEVGRAERELVEVAVARRSARALAGPAPFDAARQAGRQQSSRRSTTRRSGHPPAASDLTSTGLASAPQP